MKQYAADLEFEDAARLRDEIRRLEAYELGIGPQLRAKGRSTAGRAGTRSYKGKSRKKMY